MIKTVQDLINERIAVGKVVNTHGLKGEVKFFPYTNSEEIVKNLSSVVLYNREKKVFYNLSVESVRRMNKLFLIKFETIDTVEAAEKIKGCEVFIKYEELPPLQNDEYYFYEILGCEVYYESGECVGKVVDIIETGSNDVLVVKKKNRETLIPMIKDCVVEIKKPEKKIVVKELEWI
ncbi:MULTISPECIES: ribosome maturation factor RimM [Thermotoga]|jgi:16S rRNA processing protein RimM|uniref:Ribosome maturation factor RimM n=1 Tax=Thermotoga neapolitana (strain ATCC 49049 / DSM 4359 / NBRC 107923 / NS-E) TaxID=309803 RepID=RIMM_THENN|nr:MULTISPECIES: ribosome maturation factor RimM [Thermotoga]B9K8P4.1 RecName: Full=Ribosome maturation factor RimM [Thermotoga neapolitana DSM 4359]MDK2785837.1 rRNA processing protein RimM [Thermotoga sp.]HBF11393.1 16S rRNA processing protein RimM [Thermotoga neapolitana]ACM23327.1 16S rRNA-processing protein rimM [Thermotoga neapolitana DSM 4359]AJG41242.1 ribosome maturation factor RimM [Thermotoga sp. RQ7]KFZ21595.1 16S rRNA-processing protein rimM [Thermotoga neapolitana LA10]